MAIQQVGFQGEQQQRPKQSSGIIFPALGTVAGAGVTYFLPQGKMAPTLETLTKDKFESQVKDFTGDDKKAADTVLNYLKKQTTSATTSTPAAATTVAPSGITALTESELKVAIGPHYSIGKKQEVKVKDLLRSQSLDDFKKKYVVPARTGLDDATRGLAHQQEMQRIYQDNLSEIQRNYKELGEILKSNDPDIGLTQKEKELKELKELIFSRDENGTFHEIKDGKKGKFLTTEKSKENQARLEELQKKYPGDVERQLTVVQDEIKNLGEQIEANNKAVTEQKALVDKMTADGVLPKDDPSITEANQKLKELETEQRRLAAEVSETPEQAQRAFNARNNQFSLQNELGELNTQKGKLDDELSQITDKTSEEYAKKKLEISELENKIKQMEAKVKGATDIADAYHANTTDAFKPLSQEATTQIKEQAKSVSNADAKFKTAATQHAVVDNIAKTAESGAETVEVKKLYSAINESRGSVAEAVAKETKAATGEAAKASTKVTEAFAKIVEKMPKEGINWKTVGIGGLIGLGAGILIKLMADSGKNSEA